MTDWTREKIQEYLAEHGKDIGAAAVRGHRQSQQIVSLYTMHWRVPGDPGALGLLGGALEELEKDRLGSEEAAERGD
jgi:hypothetical protein